MGKWKNSGLRNLVDEGGKVYAIIGNDDWKVHARFEICLPGLSQGLVLAVLMTGISELETQGRLGATAQTASLNAGLASAAAAAASV